MALEITFLSGSRKGATLKFSDEKEFVFFGRDPDRSDVVFPPEEVRVSREHLALRRVLGRYRVVLNKENPVLVDGEPAHEDQQLKPTARLQLGTGGPVLQVTTVTESSLAVTVGDGAGAADGVHTVTSRLQKRHAALRRMLVILAVVIVGGAMLAYWQVSKLSRDAVDRALQKVIRRAEPSVYLVLQLDKDKHFKSGGTAWVAAPGVLATNAHVAFQFNRKGADDTFIVRSCAKDPVDLEVLDVVLHPGFHRFMQTLADYQPLDPATGKPASFPALACDVALLRVKNPERLGPPLEVASKETLADLASGVRVAYVGFPFEGVKVSDLDRPEPTSKIGHISGLKDEFLGKATDPEHRVVIQHDLGLTGGASGSPLLNPDGKVIGVVSAGSFHFFMDIASGGQVRIPSAVAVNFALRADLLSELLAGNADAAQAARSRAWVEQLKRFPSNRKSEKKVLDLLRAELRTDLEIAGVKARSIRKILEKPGRIEQSGRDHGATFRVSVPGAGHYQFVIIGDQMKALGLVLERGGKSVDEDFRPNENFAAVSVELGDHDVLDVLVFHEREFLPEAKFKLRVYRVIE